MPAHTFDRRKLLAGAGGLAVMAGAGTALTGCNNTATNSNTAEKNTGVALPTYKAYTGVTPDLPGTQQGVDPGFKLFPKDRPKAVPQTPGKGEKLSGMANIYYAIPPGPDKNQYWAGLNKRMGVDLSLSMVPNADYTTKFATTIAGGDLPDMLQMQVVANYPQLLGAKFTDLTKYLSGDAVLEYPNLANIPTRTWKSSVYNGGIYGIPIPRGAIGGYNFIRQDLFEAKGLSIDPKSYDEFVDTAKALTDTKARRWAFAGQPQNFLLRMNGAPNNWHNDGGKLTKDFETDEYKQTIQDLITMWKSGVIHPDAFSTSQPFKQLFNAGTVAINTLDGYPGWTQYILDNTDTPGFKLGLMPIYARTGGQLAKWFYGSGVFSITGIKKQDSEDKLKLILRVLNYLASPFGTEEYFYRLYGTEGVDHTLDSNGNPVFTKVGTANTVLPIRYMADAPYTLYQPGRPQDAVIQHDYQTLEIPTGIADPTIGLFSNTGATKSATINKTLSDATNEIIQGRQPFSSLDGLVKTWLSSGGEKIRGELQDQLQAAGGPSASQT